MDEQNRLLFCLEYCLELKNYYDSYCICNFGRDFNSYKRFILVNPIHSFCNSKLNLDMDAFYKEKQGTIFSHYIGKVHSSDSVYSCTFIATNPITRDCNTIHRKRNLTILQILPQQLLAQAYTNRSG